MTLQSVLSRLSHNVDDREVLLFVCFWGFAAKTLSTVKLSAPGKGKFVYPRSFGDVGIQRTSAEGLVYDLCPFVHPSPLPFFLLRKKHNILNYLSTMLCKADTV